jgi:hypothetical protein
MNTLLRRVVISPAAGLNFSPDRQTDKQGHIWRWCPPKKWTTALEC